MTLDAGLQAHVLEHAPCGLVAYSDDGIIRFANPRLHEWIEAPPGALVGTRLDAILTPAARVFHSTHLFPLLKVHGVADEMHLTLRSGSGSDTPALVNAVREIGRAGPLNHWALLPVRRRTEFEAALVEARQAALDAAAAKDQFLAVVSHELRNPLSAITGWIRLARSGKLDAATMARALETIDRNTQVQAQLIDDLLDVSRIASGKLRISPKPLNLAPIVEAVIDTARPAAVAKTVTISAVIDSHAGTVHADPARLQQIVWNLLVNAVKFTPKGGRVQVVLARSGSRVQLSVADNGIGIAPEELPYVFERFWQAASGGQRESSGLGLGLSICRSLVELHGGSIRAESAGPGQGAAFSVEFPLAVAATASSEAPPPDVEPVASLRGLRVLVVDDDDDARSLLTMLLEGAHASVRTAASADEALQLLAGDSFDVMLSDIGMPGKDGFAMMRELRATPALAATTTAMIALTGLSRPEDRVRVLRAGFQASLCKPVDPTELMALVSALAHRRAPAPGAP